MKLGHSDCSVGSGTVRFNVIQTYSCPAIGRPTYPLLGTTYNRMLVQTAAIDQVTGCPGDRFNRPGRSNREICQEDLSKKDNESSDD